MNFIFSCSLYILHNNFHKNTILFQSQQPLSILSTQSNYLTCSYPGTFP
nr:MAG TPA_asm: hypothetical protein [Bacteriophage sp.]